MFKHTITEALELAELLRPSWPTISVGIAKTGVPTCEIADPRQKLRSIELELSEAREGQAVLRRDAEKAKAAFVKSDAKDPSSGVYKRARKASDELADANKKVDDLTAVQVGTLKMFGQNGRAGRDQNGPRSGTFGSDGWSHLARELDPQAGRNRVDVPLGDLLRSPAMAGLTVTPSSGLSAPALYGPFIEKAQDTRHIWEAFPFQQLDPGVLAISDYRQSGARTVTGAVERDPVSTASKAKLALAVTLETPPLKQQALIVDGVPAKLLEIEGFDLFLRNELAYQLSLSLDKHVLAQIAAAAPPTGSTGPTLIEKARNGVSAMRALGGVPRVLALSPTDAAALDVQKTGTAGLEQYVFGSKDSGSAGPLWNMAIVEVPGLEAPMLIDPKVLAMMYAGTAMLLLDPYSGADTNTVRLRLEVEALLHIRDIAGAYVIS
jgi:hypothetical protein